MGLEGPVQNGTSAPAGRSRNRSSTSQRILALALPYGSRSAAPSPSDSATSWMGRSFTARAISMSCFPIRPSTFLVL